MVFWRRSLRAAVVRQAVSPKPLMHVLAARGVCVCVCVTGRCTEVCVCACVRAGGRAWRGQGGKRKGQGAATYAAVVGADRSGEWAREAVGVGAFACAQTRKSSVGGEPGA
eukprot:3694555-Pleurochrysis_carterae.AAC.1